MAYEPLRGQRHTNFSVPLGGRKSSESPLTHNVTAATPGAFEEVLMHGDDDLPATYLGPEMRRASVLVRQRISQLEPPRETQKPKGNLLDWLPEVAWVVLSVICIIVIVAVLQKSDGQPPPRWVGGLSLNALLAYFVSIAQFAHTIPVLESLGQLRWLRYSGSRRPLSEFDAIDQAARGSYGAFLLLFRLNGGVLGILGASIVIQGILTAAATQAAIEYRTELRAGPGIAQAGRLPSLSGDAETAFLTNPGATVNVTRSLLSGLSTNTNNIKFQQSMRCCTQDCVWPDFTSLGICTRVENIASLLAVTKLPDSAWENSKLTGTYRIALPSIGLAFVAPNAPSLAVAVSSSPSASLRGIETETTILDAYVIYGNPSPAPGGAPSFGAVEILYYWCAQRYSMQLQDGQSSAGVKLIPTTVSARNATSLAAQYNRDVATCLERGETCRSQTRGGVTLRAGETGEEFSVGELASVDLSRTLARAFGDIDKPIPRGGSLSDPDGTLARVIGAEIVGLDPAAQIRAIEGTAANIATAVSDSLRAMGHSSLVNGTALALSVCIVVRWAWLVYPASQIVLSAVLLALIAAWTRRDGLPVLKTSTLASVVALDEEARMFLSKANGREELGDWSKKLNMAMEQGDSGLGVTLAAVKDGAFATLSFTGGLTGLRKRRADKRYGVYYSSASAPVSPR